MLKKNDDNKKNEYNKKNDDNKKNEYNMALISEVKYETELKNLKNLSPESILSMLQDVRNNIGNLETNLKTADLIKILEIIEKGSYLIEGNVSIKIDFSSAQNIIDNYRRYSEGGCQSCVNLGKEIIDAQDATSGRYCQIYDPDYDETAFGSRTRVCYQGFSPKISKYYKNPCNEWEPWFSPKLDELLEKRQI